MFLLNFSISYFARRFSPFYRYSSTPNFVHSLYRHAITSFSIFISLLFIFFVIVFRASLDISFCSSSVKFYAFIIYFWSSNCSRVGSCLFCRPLLLKLEVVTLWLPIYLFDFLDDSLIRRLEVFFIYFNYYLRHSFIPEKMRESLVRRTSLTFSSLKRLILFGGQGTQEKGMLNSILHIPDAKDELIHFSNMLGEDFEEISTVDKQNKINDTQITQPLILISHYLNSKYVNNFILNPADTMVGHSVGQYFALVAAHSLDIESALRIVQERGRLMKKYSSSHTEHAMLMVRFSDQNRGKVVELVKEFPNLFIGAYNSPNNINISGEKNPATLLKNKLRQQKITTMFLPVSTPFHCPLLGEMVEPFRRFISSFQFKVPECKIIRNVDCEGYKDGEHIREGLLRHLVEPVQFWGCIKKWKEEGSEGEIIEIGHRQFVKKFADESLKKMRKNQLSL